MLEEHVGRIAIWGYATLHDPLNTLRRFTPVGTEGEGIPRSFGEKFLCSLKTPITQEVTYHIFGITLKGFGDLLILI